MGIFKPCDIRGVYGGELTDRDAYNLGRAAGPGPVPVAGAGTLTTPAFYFAVHRVRAAVGVMVTASHNPPEYNGFKLLFGQRPLAPSQLAALRRTVAEEDFGAGRGSYRREEGWLDRYRDFLLGRFRPGRLKVVLDCGNGACSLIAPGIFRALGYRVTELYCTPDGRFPNRPPNPAVAANLDALGREVVAAQAAVGVAYDGDGDRVAFVTGTGRPLENDRVLALLVRHLPARPRVVYDVKCSLVVAEEVVRRGGTPVPARSGHAFVCREFRERDAHLAGELSGHFFWRDLGFDDGLFSSLVVAELLAQSPMSLAGLDESLPRYPVTPDIRLPFAGDPRDLVEEAARKLAAYPLSRLDGVRVDLGDAWGLLRPSVTEPLVTMRYEGKTAARLAYVTDLVLSVLPAQLQVRAREVLAAGP